MTTLKVIDGKTALTGGQTAKRIGISRTALSSWVKQGLLTPDVVTPTGRIFFYKETVDAFCASITTQTGLLSDEDK